MRCRPEFLELANLPKKSGYSEERMRAFVSSVVVDGARVEAAAKSAGISQNKLRLWRAICPNFEAFCQSIGRSAPVAPSATDDCVAIDVRSEAVGATEEALSAIYSAYAIGALSIEHAARHAGVSGAQLREWCQQDPKILENLRRIQAERAGRLHQLLERHALMDHKAAIWLLERDAEYRTPTEVELGDARERNLLLERLRHPSDQMRALLVEAGWSQLS